MGILEKKKRKELIQSEVKKQVKNVSLIIQDLIARKIADLKAQNPEGHRQNAEQSADYGLLYNSVLESLDNLKTEMYGAISSETVRQVKIMLSDIQKKLKGLSTSSIKAILDAVFNFIPATVINKTPAGDYTSTQLNYTKATTSQKASELRRVIRDMLLKFTHDNSIKFLGSNIYPLTYQEAKRYFDIEHKSNEMANDIKKHEKDQMNMREKSIQDGILQYFYDPAHFKMLLYALENGSILNTLRHVGQDSRELKKLEDLNPPDYYNDLVFGKLQEDLNAFDPSKAVNNVSDKINALSEAKRNAIYIYLDENQNDTDAIYNYLAKKHIKPTSLSDLLSI